MLSGCWSSISNGERVSPSLSSSSTSEAREEYGAFARDIDALLSPVIAFEGGDVSCVGHAAREVLLERRASRIEETQTVLLVQSDTLRRSAEPVALAA